MWSTFIFGVGLFSALSLRTGWCCVHLFSFQCRAERKKKKNGSAKARSTDVNWRTPPASNFFVCHPAMHCWGCTSRSAVDFPNLFPTYWHRLPLWSPVKTSLKSEKLSFLNQYPHLLTDTSQVCQAVFSPEAILTPQNPPHNTSTALYPYSMILCFVTETRSSGYWKNYSASVDIWTQ